MGGEQTTFLSLDCLSVFRQSTTNKRGMPGPGDSNPAAAPPTLHQRERVGGISTPVWHWLQGTRQLWAGRQSYTSLLCSILRQCMVKLWGIPCPGDSNLWQHLPHCTKGVGLVEYWCQHNICCGDHAIFGLSSCAWAWLLTLNWPCVIPCLLREIFNINWPMQLAFETYKICKLKPFFR